MKLRYQAEYPAFMNLNHIILTFCFFSMWIISAPAQIKFDFKVDDHDFGVVEEGANLTYSFEFTNAGKDTIHLKEESRDVRPGCSCTASEYTRESIAPGGKGFIKAGYNTTGRLGTFNKSITISQKNTPYKILTIKGVVVKKTEKGPAETAARKTPQFVIDKQNHHFGKNEAGKNLTHKFTLKNPGKDTLKITKALSACNCITYKIINPKDNTEESFVSAGKSAVLQVTYAPASPSSMSDFYMADILTLFTNDPKNPKIELSLQSETTPKK